MERRGEPGTKSLVRQGCVRDFKGFSAKAFKVYAILVDWTVSRYESREQQQILSYASAFVTMQNCRPLWCFTKDSLLKLDFGNGSSLC